MKQALCICGHAFVYHGGGVPHRCIASVMRTDGYDDGGSGHGMLTSCKCEAFVLDRLLECEDYDDPVAVSLGLWELDEAWRVASIP